MTFNSPVVLPALRQFFLDQGRILLGLLLVMGCGTVAALVGLAFAPARAQPLPANVLVSDPNSELFDMEFDPVNAQFGWVDKTGKVWVADVDPVSGDFIPANGQKFLIHINGAPPDQKVNGPEWGVDSTGSRWVFTINAGGTTALATATFSNGRWQTIRLEGSADRKGPLPSRNPQDPTSRIVYLGFDESTANRVLYWRETDDPASERRVTDTAQGGRWVDGKNQLVFVQPVDDNTQILTLEVDTDTLEQISTDRSEKNVPFSWQAPEFNNDQLIGALANNTSIAIYQKNRLTWQRIATLRPPTHYRFLNSPEVFVYQGKSYIAFQAGSSKNANDLVPGEIWICDISSTNPLYRRVSDPSVRVRQDPEVFITETGPYVYYSDLTDSVSKIFKASTGL